MRARRSGCPREAPRRRAAPRRRDGHLCGAALGGDGGCAEWQDALAQQNTLSNLLHRRTIGIAAGA